MAKALLGYVGGSDPRLLAEMRRLLARWLDTTASVGPLVVSSGEEEGNE